MPPRKKTIAQSNSRSIAQQKHEQRIAKIAQEQEEEDSENQPLATMAYVRRSKAKEASKRKTKDAVTKRRKKDVLDTTQSLPPRGKYEGRKKRLGAETRGINWESGGDRSRVVIHEHDDQDEQDEEESEDEDNVVPPSQLASQSEVGGPSQQPTQGNGKKGKGKDHKKAVRVCRNQAADCWKLSEECEEVQQIIMDSGLYALVENYVKPDSVTVNCFVER
ncbi:hypothetical protein C5167_036788 [Papaver somniferum]|uniref:Uncharacterized protein n=1 Tax=Papaver somniferum TaxID=3469 RepID=A0A4Y7I8V9_PAPSO|nr:hypothetical protein C5167_036788 [Papaver somniferum]